MSGYYKPHRNPRWNYGGPNWKLSRSKIDLFLNCPKCFYIDNKLGTARPPGFPFNLNSAVDTLFKKEFDIHRNNKTKHPLMEQYGVDAIPFQHPKMDEWRENFKGIRTQHTATGFDVGGAVDDIWINPQGELIVVDYKSTSKDAVIDALDQDWQIGYKRQMEVYQWLLRENGFAVSDTGYFVYANGDTSKNGFNNVLEFETTLIPYAGSTQWIEPVILSIKQCLDDPRIPKEASDCDYCTYRGAAGNVQLQHKQHTNDPVPEKRATKPAPSSIQTPSSKDTLF